MPRTEPRNLLEGPMPRFDLGHRAAGILAHLTSLPGPHGCGDLGPPAHRFVDFLGAARQGWWQMLPVGPLGYGNSPYSAQSAFAGSALLVSPDRLVDDGLLPARALADVPRLPKGRVDFAATSSLRERMLRAAHAAARSGPRRARRRAALDAFRDESAGWLDDFALFRAVKREHGERALVDWPEPLRRRDPAALDAARSRLADEIDFQVFVQWRFASDWRALREAAAEAGVGLIGDVPIFVAHDSADVWAHPELFKLDAAGAPRVVAGVPPDYFSKSGQRWGNPLYDWDASRASGYRWWIERVGVTLGRFDAIRLDHFIGFHRAWEVPASAETAVDGQFVPGPGDELFHALRAAHGRLPFIAEDLGLVTDEVRALRDRLELPGMKVLQFAFGGDPSAGEFRPYSYPRRAVAYTGTHDNDTIRGWFDDRGGESTRSARQAAAERRAVLAFLGTDGREVHFDLVRALYASVANMVVVPMQDLLGLGSEARMNRPGWSEGNWEWRMKPTAASARLARRLAELCEVFGRGPHPAEPAARRSRKRRAGGAARGRA